MLTQWYELTDIPAQLPASVTPLTLSGGEPTLQMVLLLKTAAKWPLYIPSP